MDKEKLINYIKSPDSLDQESLEMFGQILNEFPYFQTARLLFLRNLQNLKSSNIKSELKKAATHISNREKLFLLLKDIEESAEKIEEKVLGNPEEKGVVEKVTAVKDKQTDDKTEILSDIISQRLNEIKKGDTLKTDSDDDSKISKEKGFEHIADTILKKAAEQKIVKESKEGEISKDVNQNTDLLIIDSDEKINKDQEIEENIIFEDAPDKENKDLLLLESNEEISTTHYDKSMKLLFFHKVNILDLKLPSELFTKEEDDEAEEEDLIGKFIEKNPTISRNLESEYRIENHDISKKSVQENEEYLTDTLVEIYIKQGYYTKAILAYEKLSLKYPEKSSYFAKQIEKIKKLNNKK